MHKWLNHGLHKSHSSVTATSSRKIYALTHQSVKEDKLKSISINLKFYTLNLSKLVKQC